MIGLPNYIQFLEHWFRELLWKLRQIALDKLEKLIAAMQKLYRWLNSRTPVEVERDRYSRLATDRYERPRSRR